VSSGRAGLAGTPLGVGARERTVRGEFATLKRASGKLARGRKSLCSQHLRGVQPATLPLCHFNGASHRGATGTRTRLLPRLPTRRLSCQKGPNCQSPSRGAPTPGHQETKGRHRHSGAGGQVGAPPASPLLLATSTVPNIVPPRRGVCCSCQGTRTFTQLVDTNLYAQNRLLRTARSNRGLLPAPPGRGLRSLLPAAELFLVFPAFGFLASFATGATFPLPGETEAGSAGAQPTKG
jgi:hypothetical protein